MGPTAAIVCRQPSDPDPAQHALALADDHDPAMTTAPRRAQANGCRGKKIARPRPDDE